MKDRLLLLGYVAAVIAATTVHDPRWLAAGMLVALLAAGSDAPRLLRRTLLYLKVPPDKPAPSTAQAPAARG